MKKIVLIFCLLVFYKVTVAQSITFLYELSQKRDSDDNKYSTTPFYLDVMGKESVFRSEKDRYSDSLVEKTGFGIGSGLTFANQFYVKKNLSKMEIIKSITTPLMNDKYDLKISDTLDWQISPEKQRIGEIECQKAYLKYGGRSWVAWFSESIPLQDGPYIFNGLPGLIVKISDEQSNFVFNLVEVMSSKKKNTLYLRKGKLINWETFKKIQLDYYNDPYAEVKTKNIKYQVADSNGNPISMNFKQLTENIQKQIKASGDPIELDHKLKYQ